MQYIRRRSCRIFAVSCADAADDYAMVTPVYETMPGWKESTFGVTEFDKLPVNARNYVRRLEELAGVKIAILSTGPERDQTIYIEDPFA